MLHVQSYLRNSGILRRKVDELGLTCKVQDGKVLLNYSMIDSPKLDPIVKECRGLILYEDNWDVASMAFERFFNYGEGGAEDLGENLSHCLVLPKLDGTMVSLWYDRISNQWRVATRGMMYAEGSVGQLSTKSFAELFWEGARKAGFNIKSMAFQPNCTYVFELTSLENRIVTPYSETSITLLTIRNNETLKEYSWEQTRRLQLLYPMLKVIDPVKISDWSQLRKMEGLAATDEGFVVVKESDGSHRRVKVKNPSYLAIAKLFGKGTTEKVLVELFKSGDWPEFLAYYPEYEKNIKHLQNVFQKLCNVIRRDYVDLESFQDRKSFAMEALKKSFPSVLFAMRDGKITTLEKDLLLMPVDKLLDMIHRVETL